MLRSAKPDDGQDPVGAAKDYLKETEIGGPTGTDEPYVSRAC